MTVLISKLPSTIQAKFPPSIKLLKDEWEIDELPKLLQYEVYQYLTAQPQDVKYENNTYDLQPSLTAYNDLKGLPLKNAILEYFRNFLYVSVGAYPFDTTFGSRLKRYLQTKDTELKKTYIENELQNICIVITNDYNVPVKILSAKLINRDMLADKADVYSEYFMEVDLKIESETVKLQV